MADRFFWLKFDTEESPDLAEKYNISALPATLIGSVSRDTDGNFVFTSRERLDGFQSAEDLLKKLKRRMTAAGNSAKNAIATSEGFRHRHHQSSELQKKLNR